MTGEFDKVYLIYTHFQSAIKQEVTVRGVPAPETGGKATGDEMEYLYEPDMESIVDPLHPALRTH